MCDVSVSAVMPPSATIFVTADVGERPFSGEAVVDGAPFSTADFLARLASMALSLSACGVLPHVYRRPDDVQASE